MATPFQEKAAENVSVIFRLLQSGEKDLEQYKSAYTSFLSNIELLNGEPQGNSLATACCIPIWELLNYLSSLFISQTGKEQNVFLLQMLCSLYMKSKDRRSSFQSLAMLGDDPAVFPTLTSHVPYEIENVSSSLRTLWSASTSATSILAKFIAVAKVICCGGSTSDQIIQASKTFLRDVLPCCRIRDGSNEESAHSTNDPNSTTELVILLNSKKEGLSTWKNFSLIIFLMLVKLEFTNTTNGRDLVHYLTASPWASKKVENSAVTHGSLCLKITDSVMVCISVNSKTPAGAVDNVPLIDPHLAVLFSFAEGKAPRPQYLLDLDCKSKQVPCDATKKYAEYYSTLLNDKLSSDIPNEIEFSGSSATSRYVDSLTSVCRGLLNASVKKEDSAGTLSVRKVNALLFSRKRGRDGEGPSFIPGTVDEFIDDANNNNSSGTKLCCLERLCKAWQMD